VPPPCKLFTKLTGSNTIRRQYSLNASGKTIPPASARFVRKLIWGVLDNLDEIDALVQEIAPEWPLLQMSPIDRNILRIAVYELMIARDTPVKVAINEAVELAKLFGGDSTRRFVNGALGTLVSRYIKGRQ